MSHTKRRIDEEQRFSLKDVAGCTSLSQEDEDVEEMLQERNCQIMLI